MSRKTKAELQAEAERMQEEETKSMEVVYPVRMMVLLERAIRVNFEVDVRRGRFVLFDRDNNVDTFAFANTFSRENYEVLDALESEVQWKEKREAERKLVEEVKRTALAKLTIGERKALGLP